MTNKDPHKCDKCGMPLAKNSDDWTINFYHDNHEHHRGDIRGSKVCSACKHHNKRLWKEKEKS